MAVIELGEVAAGPDPEPPPDRRALRRWAGAALALVCLLAVTGSVRPAPRLLRGLWSVAYEPGGGNRLVLAADTAYVLGTGAPPAVTAYRLADGAVRWTRRLTGGASWLSPAGPGGVLLLPADESVVGFVDLGGSQVRSATSGGTVALDPGTGAELWRRPGDVAWAGADLVLLADPGDRPRAGTLRQVAAADGAVRWERPLDGAAYWSVTRGDPAAGRVVTVTADGRVRVLRLRDGAPVAGGRVEVGSGRDGSAVDVVADGGDLWVNRITRGRLSATVYEVDTLRRRWRVDPAMPGSGGLYACGALLCRADATGTVAYDRTGGTFRWGAVGWTNAVPVGGGRLLADSGDGLRRGLLDAATGRLVADLGDTRIAPSDAGVPVGAFGLADTRADGRRSAVYRVDLRTGVRTLRGTVDRVREPGCRSTGDRLVCVAAGGRLTVTAVG